MRDESLRESEGMQCPDGHHRAGDARRGQRGMIDIAAGDFGLIGDDVGWCDLLRVGYAPRDQPGQIAGQILSVGGHRVLGQTAFDDQMVEETATQPVQPGRLTAGCDRGPP